MVSIFSRCDARFRCHGRGGDVRGGLFWRRRSLSFANSYDSMMFFKFEWLLSLVSFLFFQIVTDIKLLYTTARLSCTVRLNVLNKFKIYVNYRRIGIEFVIVHWN